MIAAMVQSVPTRALERLPQHPRAALHQRRCRVEAGISSSAVLVGGPR